jgi:pimeloyl-ACP methyl ester carboxylesterase
VINIYCISGLGADHTVFNRLHLPNVQLVAVPWLAPENKETLANYALRMAAQIPEAQPILLGLSFGGLVAQEIAKQRPIKKLILLSTMQQPTGLRSLLHTYKKFPVYNWLPASMLRWVLLRNIWVFGKLNAKNKKALRNMIHQFSPTYYKWAFGQILNWNGKGSLEVPVCHIHGSKDWLFPIAQAKPDFAVMDAGHLMVLTHAKQVSGLIAAYLHTETSAHN